MAYSQGSNLGTFSIATPALNNIISISENTNDSTYMVPTSSYQQETTMDPIFLNEKDAKFPNQNAISNFQTPTPTGDKVITIQTLATEHNTSQTALNDELSDASKQQDEHGTRFSKKRNKAAKKSTKLDAKSKLEKSRQSARECRARKKLRYQYLEDLVCNREKAVIKLREELSMFCDLSRQIESGTVSEADRRLLSDQAKENSGT